MVGQIASKPLTSTNEKVCFAVVVFVQFGRCRQWLQRAVNRLLFPQSSESRCCNVFTGSVFWFACAILIFDERGGETVPLRGSRVSEQPPQHHVCSQRIHCRGNTLGCPVAPHTLLGPSKRHQGWKWLQTFYRHTSEDQKYQFLCATEDLCFARFIFSHFDIFQFSKRLWSTANAPSESHLTLVTTPKQPVSGLPLSSSSWALVYTAALVFAPTSFTNCCHMPP